MRCQKQPHPVQGVFKNAHRVAAGGTEAQDAHVHQLLGQVGGHRAGKSGTIDKGHLVPLLQQLFGADLQLGVGIVIQQRLGAEAVEEVFLLLHGLMRCLGKGAQLVAHIHKATVIHLARQPHNGGGGGIVRPRHPAHTLGLHRVQVVQDIFQHGALRVGQIFSLRDFFDVQKSTPCAGLSCIVRQLFFCGLNGIVPLIHVNVKNRFPDDRIVANKAFWPELH